MKRCLFEECPYLGPQYYYISCVYDVLGVRCDGRRRRGRREREAPGGWSKGGGGSLSGGDGGAAGVTA